MSSFEERLEELGIELPPPKAPVANYLGCKQSGNLLFVSGRVSRLRGAVGSEVDLDTAKAAARDTIIDILAIVRSEIGSLDRIREIVQMRGFVRSSHGFIEQPLVIDGASELLIELFGERGRHARTATGTSQLPFGAAIQLDLVMRLDSANH